MTGRVWGGEGGRDGRREGGREGGQGGDLGRREGGKEGGKEGGREGGRTDSFVVGVKALPDGLHVVVRAATRLAPLQEAL